MKKFIYAFVLVCIFSLADVESFASHTNGVEMTYSCTSTPGVWRVTLIISRDCQGIPLGSCTSTNCNLTCAYTVTVAGADPVCNGTTFTTFTVNLISVSDVDPNPQCPSFKSNCTNMGCVTAGTFVPGIEKYIFQGDVNLGTSSGIPSSCCNIRLFWSECCRSSASNSGGGNNLYVEAIINRCLSASPCNGAPILFNDPVLFLTSGQPFLYNPGAIDPDNDSLSYSFAPALSGPNSPVSYISPYSATQPFPFFGGVATAPWPLGIHCDSINGNIGFTPTYTGSGYFTGIMTIQIKQWKKISGVPMLVGTTMRECLMYLAQYPANNPPRILTNPSNPLNSQQPKLSWGACAGRTLCFDVIAKDTDLSDTTYLGWNASLAGKGATFLPNYTLANRKINGPREDSYKFCWTPDSTMISSLPYYFTVKAKDSRCPIAGKIWRAIDITVVGNPTATISKISQPCYKWNFTYSSPHPEYIASQQWQISNTKGIFNNSDFSSFNSSSINNFSFNDTGKFVVKLILSAQSSAGTTLIYDTVYNPIAFRLFNLPDTTVCSGTTLKLKANHYGGISPYAVQWFDITQTGTILSSNDSLIVTPTTLKNYKFTVNDSAGCFLSDISSVNVNPLPTSVLPAFARVCKGTFDTLDPGNNIGNIKSYLWNTGDTTQIIIRNDSNLFWVKLTDTLGCSLRDTFLLFVNQLPNVNAGSDVAICTGQPTLLQATGAQNYQWFALPSSSVIGNYSLLNVNPTSTTNYRVSGNQIISGVSCSNSDTVKVTVNPKPALPVISGPDSVKVNYLNTFNVANHAVSSYNWFLNNGTINSGQGTNSAGVTFTSAGTRKINVIESQNNCASDTASKTVTVNVVIGLNEKNIFDHLNIYPNPTTGLLNIEFETSEKNIELEVFDVIGKSVLKNNLQHSGGLFQHFINMTSLNHGIYFVKISAGEKSITVKVAVK
ncbi:MAG: T9SS type A sorting domain-containing protein [Bacteroidia bacterium]